MRLIDEGLGCQQRPEHLAVQDLVVLTHNSDHGRLEEEATISLATPTGDQLRMRGQSIDEAMHA
ncbi:MAG: hypothetical protein ABI873_15755 [Marmoricola sp.]